MNAPPQAATARPSERSSHPAGPATAATREVRERLRASVLGALATLGTAVTVDWRDLADPRAEAGTAHDVLGGGPVVSVRLVPGGLLVAATPGGEGRPCPGCLDLRRSGALPEVERRAVDDPHGALLGPASDLPSFVAPVVAHLVTRAVDATDGPARARPVWRLAVPGGSIDRVGLLGSSECPTCAGQGSDSPGADLLRGLRSAPATRPGGSRGTDVEALGLPVSALANPVCGVLGGAPIRSYRATASAPTSGRFLVRSKYGLHEMWWGGHTDTYAQSELVGILEGLERVAGQSPHRPEPITWARRSELTGPVVEMETCGTYDPEFYADHAHKYVPWEENPSIPWVRGRSLRDDRDVWVPEQLVYYLDHREGHRNTVQECSNGCASGSTLTEASLHGLLELIERDAFVTSWYAPVTPAEIDLDTVTDRSVQHMRDQLDLLGYDTRCFDIRSDLPVPAVGCVAVRRDGGPGTLCFAGGAGLAPDDAVRAAVCEVASYVPGFDERVERRREFLEAAIADLHLITELDQHPLLFGMPEMRGHADHWLRQDVATPMTELYADWEALRTPHTDLLEPLRLLVGLFADRGMDTVVVDQTTPEQERLGVRTVATVVPGLVPIDFGWARQRALRMPRTLTAHHAGGRAAAPFRPDQLVPYPHPFP